MSRLTSQETSRAHRFDRLLSIQGATLAQSVGIPVVRLDSIEIVAARHGKEVVVDGDAAQVILAPSRDETDSMVETSPGTDWRSAHLPVALSLSVIAPEQLLEQDWRGIDGVGLYRTEMLFLKYSDRFPSEDEQCEAYKRLFKNCGEREVVIRTVDLGADKAVQHMHFGPEVNPYLGLRAHRIFRYHPEILVTQLRAILRAAEGRRQVHLLFPMLETLDQWNFVHSLLDEAVASLRNEGLTLPGSIMSGVLVETPAAVWSFPDLIECADFASVGTNDLVQYVFAIERDAPNVAFFYQPEHPVMVRILHDLVVQASAAGKKLSICGEIASEPQYLALLVGLGFEHITVAAAQADRVGQSLAKLEVDECRALAAKCLNVKTATEVRSIMDLQTPNSDHRTFNAGHAVDPVCGMAVHAETTVFTLEQGSRFYHFCSAQCMSRFRDELQSSSYRM